MCMAWETPNTSNTSNIFMTWISGSLGGWARSVGGLVRRVGSFVGGWVLCSDSQEVSDSQENPDFQETIRRLRCLRCGGAKRSGLRTGVGFGPEKLERNLAAMVGACVHSNPNQACMFVFPAMPADFLLIGTPLA